MKQKKTEKVSFLGKLMGGASGISGELFGEWRGRGRVTVGGAKRIGFFSEDKILVLLAKERLWVCGRRLMCLSFQNEVLAIGGEICSVAYEEGER